MKAEESNTIIAGYMGLANMDDYFITHKGRLHLNELEYHNKIEWIYPVYLKIRKELIEKEDYFKTDMVDHYKFSRAYTFRSHIEVALIQGDIQELHSEIVKGITFLNEQKK